MGKAKLFESIFRRLLRESEDRGYASLACFERQDGTGRSAVIYDPSKLKDALGADPDLSAAAEDAVLGVLTVAPTRHSCNGAWSVKASWAKNAGDGRLIYGLAYVISPNGKLIPDRTEVSDRAIKGWESAKNKGFQDKPLDDYTHKNCEKTKTHTDDESDDCVVHGLRMPEFLNYSYMIPDSEAEKYASLLSMMKKNHQNSPQAEDALLDAAFRNFRQKVADDAVAGLGLG
jgi:hypothetical protein